MKEKWKQVENFPGYEVSNTGKVRSFWKKTKRFGCWGGTERTLTDTPYEMPQSDDGNGYMKVLLQNDKDRRCIKVHRLVAEAYIPRKNGCDTVDHIKSGPEGKLDNSVKNLRWISRRENIQKAYKDGMCDDRINRSKKPIILYDEWSGDEHYCESVREAGEFIGRNQTTISHAIKSGEGRVSHYIVSEASWEERALHGYDYGEYGYY